MREDEKDAIESGRGKRCQRERARQKMPERAGEAKDVRESGVGERAVRANEAKHVRERRDVRN